MRQQFKWKLNNYASITFFHNYTNYTIIKKHIIVYHKDNHKFKVQMVKKNEQKKNAFKAINDILINWHELCLKLNPKSIHHSIHKIHMYNLHKRH